MSNFERIDQRLREKIPSSGFIGPLDPVINLGAAGKTLDISVSMLRKYESEGLIIYFRTDTSRRMLCREDIDRIRLIKRLNKVKGINFEGIRRLLALLPCWELKPCTPAEKEACSILQDSTKPCWSLKNTVCAERGEDCRSCVVYRFGAFCTEDIKALVHGGGESAGAALRLSKNKTEYR